MTKNNTKKTILFTTPSANLYGAEKILLNIIRYLRHDYHLHVLLPEKGMLSGKLSEIDEVKLHFLPVMFLSTHENPLNLVNYIRGLKKIASGIRPDVVYCHGEMNHLIPVASFLCRYKCIWHLHGCITPHRLSAKLMALIAAYCTRKLVFVSEFTRSSYAAYCKRIVEKSVVVYNGIEDFKTAERWFFVCTSSTGLGWHVWRLFRQSPLSKLSKPSLSLKVKFWIKCLLRWHVR